MLTANWLCRVRHSEAIAPAAHRNESPLAPGLRNWTPDGPGAVDVDAPTTSIGCTLLIGRKDTSGGRTFRLGLLKT
jgi:hypothetical protein